MIKEIIEKYLDKDTQEVFNYTKRIMMHKREIYLILNKETKHEIATISIDYEKASDSVPNDGDPSEGYVNEPSYKYRELYKISIDGIRNDVDFAHIKDIKMELKEYFEHVSHKKLGIKKKTVVQVYVTLLKHSPSILELGVFDLNFCIRGTFVLYNNNYKKLSDVVKLTHEELRHLPNMSRIAYETIVNILSDYGIYLKTWCIICFNMERMTGFKPVTPTWKAGNVIATPHPQNEGQ